MSGWSSDSGTTQETSVYVKGAERLLQDRNWLRQVFRMGEMGVMASSILHEIRQPLFSIKGYIQMLLLEAHKSGHVDDRLVKVHELVEDLERRASSYLDFSRDPDEQMIPLDISAPVRGAVRMFQHRLDRARVQLHLELASDLPPVKGSFSLLQQVFVNLLQNSLHALKEKAYGEPRDIWVRTQAKDDGRQVEILFGDNGPGVDADVAEKMFEYFFTTKPVGEGTGLGLAISREIVKAHGGDISLVDAGVWGGDGEAGPRILFSITLPVLSRSNP